MNVIRDAVTRDPESIGSYVISMTHGASDVLEVLLLMKECGLWSMRSGVVQCGIDVVPLHLWGWVAAAGVVGVTDPTLQRAPSANRFGKVSPTSAQHVLDDIGDLLDPERDAILDGGPSDVGVESTIVDLTVDPPQILRTGAISDAESMQP